MVAAAKGLQQSAASLLLDLAKFYEHVGHDHLWEEGQNKLPTALPTEAGGSTKQTSVPPFFSGPSGPYSQAAVAPPQWPNLSFTLSGKRCHPGSQHTGSGM